MSVESWIDNPFPWETVYVGGFGKIPGVCVVEGVKSASNWEKKKGAGVNGAYSVFQGDELGECVVKVKITTHDDLQKMQRLKLFVMPPLTKKNAKRLPQSYFHPTLIFHGLRAMTLDAFEGPSTPGSDGISEFSIRLTQWEKPPKASVTTRPTTGGFGKMGADGLDALGVVPKVAPPSASGPYPAPRKL